MKTKEKQKVIGWHLPKIKRHFRISQNDTEGDGPSAQRGKNKLVIITARPNARHTLIWHIYVPLYRNFCVSPAHTVNSWDWWECLSVLHQSAKITHYPCLVYTNDPEDQSNTKEWMQ
jgi:hypothetical protein